MSVRSDANTDKPRNPRVSVDATAAITAPDESSYENWSVRLHRAGKIGAPVPPPEPKPIVGSLGEEMTTKTKAASAKEERNNTKVSSRVGRRRKAGHDIGPTSEMYVSDEFGNVPTARQSLDGQENAGRGKGKNKRRVRRRGTPRKARLNA